MLHNLVARVEETSQQKKYTHLHHHFHIMKTQSDIIRVPIVIHVFLYF